MDLEGMHRKTFRIERIHNGRGSEVMFSPGRGGIITSLRLGGREVLYMDDSTFKDPSKNVRGGIPFLFPQSGPIDDPRYPGLKQHGVARLSDKWSVDASSAAGTFAETLRVDQPLPEYPFPFEFTAVGEFNDEASFRLLTIARNLGAEPMPISMGLHPYFRTPAHERANIRFEFPGGEKAERDADTWMNDGTISLDNPGQPMRVVLPGEGTIELMASPEYAKVLVWSKPGADFVCIEPVMGDDGKLTRDPYMVPPGDSLAASLTIRAL